MELIIYNFQRMLLIFMRISGIMFATPFFSSLVIPVRLRIIFSIFLTLILSSALKNFNMAIPPHIGQYGLMALGQLVLGLILGFIVAIIFTAFQLAGQFFSFQMGFGIIQVYDPLSQIEIPIIGQLQYLLGIFIFLLIRAHHLLIHSLYQSFEILPFFDFSSLGHVQLLSLSLSKIFSSMFLLALKIAFPIIATMFLVAFVLGLLAKASPQMNIFMVGFPLQIGIGLIALFIILPFFVEMIANILDYTFDDMIRLLYTLK
ncbi:MAG: flagellar biosynthetic protein FliR [Spirochaetes bacterium]|nr:flagellar biosynthetic protein FliR [Spirochaetota bacterium]